MSHPLIARNRDLQRLYEEGFEIEIHGAFLVIRSVPYVSGRREVRRGTLVAPLHVNIDQTFAPTNHVVMFSGDYPCDANGRELEQLRYMANVSEPVPGITTRFGFSNKPPNGYIDHHQLVTTYVAHLEGPAQAIDPDARARTWNPIENTDPNSVFLYPDTASSRAGITHIARKLKDERIAIVGLGGTGSYILDLVAKTLVREIHLFDGDLFGSHNAFRAPGAPSIAELRQRPYKVDHFAAVYARMRRGVIPHPYFMDASRVAELDTMTFVFLCMDAGEAKRLTVERLEQLRIPFIDVGMGLTLSDAASLGGILRVVTSTPEKRDHVRAKQRIDFNGGGDDLYNNIQIADLNALNATLAVLRWKKLRGVYHAGRAEHYSAFVIDTGSLIHEDFPE